MRIRLLLAAAAALTLAACADSSTAPRLTPTQASKDEVSCRSGYHIATRDDGSQGCESDETFYSGAPAARPSAPTAPTR
jgi:uncharacterized lipoprotein YajG